MPAVQLVRHQPTPAQRLAAAPVAAPGATPRPLASACADVQVGGYCKTAIGDKDGTWKAIRPGVCVCLSWRDAPPAQRLAAAPMPSRGLPPKGQPCPWGPIDVEAQAGGGPCICWPDYMGYALLPIFAQGVAKTAGQVNPAHQCADGMLAVIYWWCSNAPLCDHEPDKIDAAWDVATMLAQHIYGGGVGEDVEGIVSDAQDLIMAQVLDKAQPGPVCFTPGGQTMNPIKVGDTVPPARLKPALPKRQAKGLSLKKAGTTVPRGLPSKPQRSKRQPRGISLKGSRKRRVPKAPRSGVCGPGMVECGQIDHGDSVEILCCQGGGSGWVHSGFCGPGSPTGHGRWAP